MLLGAGAVAAGATLMRRAMENAREITIRREEDGAFNSRDNTNDTNDTNNTNNTNNTKTF